MLILILIMIWFLILILILMACRVGLTRSGSVSVSTPTVSVWPWNTAATWNVSRDHLRISESEEDEKRFLPATQSESTAPWCFSITRVSCPCCDQTCRA